MSFFCSPAFGSRSFGVRRDFAGLIRQQPVQEMADLRGYAGQQR